MTRLGRRLFRTTTFRLSLLAAGAYSLLSAVAIGFIYWSTAAHLEAQVDTRLRLETNVLLHQYRTQALAALVDTIRQRSRDDGLPRIFFYFLERPDYDRPGGRLPDWPVNEPEIYATLRLGDLFAEQAVNPAVRVRVLATALPGGYRLWVGRDLNEAEELLQHNLRVGLTVVAITLLLALLVSGWLGRNTLRRIDTVSRTARQIMAGELSHRIPLSGRDDEFDELSRQLNAMLARIEQLMVALREVTDNIAHDLRSPLNRLRSRLEITLLESACSPEHYREVLEQAIADADRLLNTFSALLGIAQAEAGIRGADWTELELTVLAEELAELYGALAEERGSELRCRATGEVRIWGNRQLLAQALSNLLDNALKYTPAGGHIELTVTQEAGVPVVSVADSGPGIPADQCERVLERFVRLDGARGTPGNGLGLSLVKAVAQRHHATLELTDNQPGLRVSLRFGPT
jgi:signal transduction histidine kinase